MQTYALPQRDFDSLIEALGERKKAELFVQAIQTALDAVDEKTARAIAEKKGTYRFSREAFDLLVDAFADRRKAEVLVGVLEACVNSRRAETEPQ